MKKLAMSGVVLAAVLTFSIQAQAGVRDYSRTAIGQGNQIHESVERDSMMQDEGVMSAKETHENTSSLWQWDDVIYK